MRKAWPIGLLLGLLLGACSGHTVYRLEVDVLSLIPQDQRAGSLNLAQGEARLPDDPAGRLVQLPEVAGKTVEGGKLTLRIRLRNTGGTPLSGKVEVRLGPQGDNDLYDGSGGDLAWATADVNLGLGEEQSLSLTPELAGAALDQVQQGPFRIGLRVVIQSGTALEYSLEEAGLTLRLRPFKAIPPPQ